MLGPITPFPRSRRKRRADYADSGNADDPGSAGRYVYAVSVASPLAQAEGVRGGWRAPPSPAQATTTSSKGARGSDVICGKGGNDPINGMGRDDIIFAGPGLTTSFRAQEGADTLRGGQDSDVMYGGRGLDVLYERSRRG